MKTLALSIFSIFLFSFVITPSHSATLKCHPNDKKALLTIKKELNNSPLLISWDPDTNCCSWHKVICNKITNRVYQLAIFGGELNGHIPAALGDLPYLEELILRKLSNLTGEIPVAISRLSRLTFVMLSWTNLSGPVPEFFSRMKTLTFLDLSFNQLTGSIPSSLAQLPNLTTLRLDRNKLTGSIPESFGHFYPITTYIYLSHNNLTGTIPKSLGNLNFTFIDFSRNRLEGDASTLISGLNKGLQTVDLSRNLLTFDLTKIEFPNGLIDLDLSHNSIFGSLPKSMNGLKLQHFNISYNRLCGEIPLGGSLQGFDNTTYFHNRCLCGSPLPACK